MLNRLRMAILFVVVLVAAAQAQESGNRHMNPPGLVKPTGYTHVVLAADRRTVYIAGQVAFDSTGKVVGEGAENPPANTLIVANLVRPELLLEIEGIAVLPKAR